MTRTELLLSLIDTDGFGLEIGPGFNPLLPKAAGYRVETLDHATKEDLIKKYANAPGVDLSRIETVDFVSTGGSIQATVQKSACYDYIVASHVIEHTPDPLGFLYDCENLLKPDGVLALAVPDKRFSFDVLRPPSTAGDVLQAHLDGRVRSTPGNVFDEIAYNVLRGGAPGWTADNRDPLAFFKPLADAKNLFEHVRDSEVYIDIHSWQFTPSSFRLIISDLVEIGCLQLREASFHDGLGGEFIISLSRVGVGSQISRLTLAQNVIEELRAIQFA